MMIREALSWATQKLNKKTQSPALDAEVLLSFVLKKDKSWIFANPDNKLTTKQSNNFNNLIQKRANHWPVAYLTGHKEFFGLDFRVTKDTLIPRPETELLVEKALEILKNNKIKQVIDVGTGSGCIIISLASSLRGYSRGNLKFYATDISTQTLKVAKQNAKNHKIKFVQANLLPPEHVEGHSLIVANLPYLTPKQLKNPDLKHEPKSALVAGPDGLKYYRELFKQIRSLRHPELACPQRSRLRGGRDSGSSTILLEHDPSQVSKLKSLAKKHFPKAKTQFHKDLTGRFRIMELKFARF